MAAVGDTVRFAAYTSGGPAGSGIRTFTGTVVSIEGGEAVVDASVGALRPDPDVRGAQRFEDVPVGQMRVTLNEGVTTCP